MPGRLSFIHILQTEFSSQMKALRAGFGREASLSTGFSKQEDHRPCGPGSRPFGPRPSEIGPGGQQRGSLIGLCRHQGEQIRIEDFVRRTFRFQTGKIAQLQQTHCQWRQQAQQASRPVGTLHLTFFETTPGFEATSDSLPRPSGAHTISRARHPCSSVIVGTEVTRIRVLRLFAFGSVLFPDANGPQPHRFFATAFLEARRQHAQCAKSQMHFGRASRSSMTGRHLKCPAGLGRPGSHNTLADDCVVPLLARSGDSQTLEPGNECAWLGRPLQNGNISAPRSPTCTIVVSAGKRALAHDQAHPHICFPVISLPSFAPRLSFWGWRAHERFLHRTAQHLTAFWQDGQHRSQIQPASSFIAAPLPSLWFWDDGRGPLRWCPEPATQPVCSPSVRESGANEGASVRSSVTSSSSSSRYKAIVSFQVCMWAGKEAEALWAMRVAAFTARTVRRISLSLLAPKVFFAQHSGSRSSCVFIFLF
jgi:hypothetical protein